MYSRYTPNAAGGFDRTRVPDPLPQPTGDRTAAPADNPEETDDPRERSVRGDAAQPSGPPRAEKNRAAGSPPGRPVPPSRTVPPAGAAPGRPFVPPRPPSPGPPGDPPGFGGLPGRLLPRIRDTEELLILAVLLLAMKQDGAGSAELLIAAALYLIL